MNLILCGGGWGQKTTSSNKLFESLIKGSKPVLYIPFARESSDDNYQYCKTWLITKAFKDIKLGDIIVLNSAEEIADKSINDFGGVFIGGGNPYKLLKELTDGRVIDWLNKYLQTDGVIYGSSAGAMLFGKNVDSAEYLVKNEVGLQNTDGLNKVFGMSIAPHYTNANNSISQKATTYLVKYSKKTPVLALPEEDSLYINNKNVTVIGTKPYCFFVDGKSVEFQPNITYAKETFVCVR